MNHSLLKSLTLALLFSAAKCNPIPPNIQQRDVSTQDLNAMNLYSQYSAAIYCPINGVAPRGTPITCVTGSCPAVQSNGAYMYGNFYDVGLFSTTGMLAVDPVNHKLVLAFRGAENLGALSQEITDLVPCPAICPACNCHEGYYGTWTVARDTVKQLVSAAMKDYPGWHLVVTGHSLGAVQAIFAAAEFRTNGTSATLYDYGQPHVGDEAFAEYVTAQGKNYRVTHTDDPAPRMQNPSLGFRHISPEYWIYEDRSSDFSVVPNQIQVIKGTNSILGNEGTSAYDVSAHVEYFQAEMASCYVVVPAVPVT